MKTYRVCVDEKKGTIKWYSEDDALHREGGPALEYTSGERYWFWNGASVTEEHFNALINGQPTHDGKIVESDGQRYKLQAQ